MAESGPNAPNSARTVIARNTIYNAAGRLWVAAVNLVLMVYIVRRIGDAGYGVWGLVGAFTGYVALADLGLSSGFAKFIAEHNARDERDAVSGVVSTGFFFYLLVGAAIVTAGWPCVDFLIDAFISLSHAKGRAVAESVHVQDFRVLCRWALVLFALSNCVGVFTAIQTGLQRMGVTNVIGVGASLVKVAATVAFLEAGTGVRGLLYANAVVLGAFAVASIATAYWLFPGLTVSPRHISKPAFRRLFGFGWRSQVARLANLIMFETDIVVVALLFKGFGLVGLYSIGVNVANKMRQVPTLLVSALVPAASDLDAREQEEALSRLYLRSTKYVAAVAVPLALFTAGIATPLVHVMFGPGYETSAWVLRIIALGYVANIVPGAGVSVVLGKGRADIQMRAGLISMFSNIGLTVALVLSIGFWGIPIATAASMFISWAWFARAVGPVVGVGAGRMLRVSMLWPFLASLPGVLVCGVSEWLAMDVFAVKGALAFAAWPAVVAMVYWPLYAVAIGLAPFLDSFDAGFLRDTLRLGRVPGLGRWLRAASHG